MSGEEKSEEVGKRVKRKEVGRRVKKEDVGRRGVYGKERWLKFFREGWWV